MPDTRTLRLNDLKLPLAHDEADLRQAVAAALAVSDAEIEALALANPTIVAALNGVTPKKVIARAPKIVNIVL